MPLAALMLAPPLLDWLDRHPPLDPARYAAARLLDDAAYSLGVWQGCLRRRTIRPLLPMIGSRRPYSRAAAVRYAGNACEFAGCALALPCGLHKSRKPAAPRPVFHDRGNAGSHGHLSFHDTVRTSAACRHFAA